MTPPTIVTTEGAVGLVPDRFHTCWPDARPLLVADRNTWEAAGKAVERAFLQAGQATVDVLLFDERQQVHADQAHVDAVKQRLGQGDLVAIAIGAGSMNDIVKLASYECGKPYCCVPTAPSVDGYTSPNAPITIQGFKQTIPCTPPLLVVADVTVLRNAPMSMISSGYGDLVAKITGGADWLIADALGVEPVDRKVWDLVQLPLRGRIGSPEALLSRDPVAIDSVFSGLVETGLAMLLFGNSRPASGSEHLLSHVWEMKGLSFDGELVSHGHKVAMGTLITTAMMTRITEIPLEAMVSSWKRNPSISFDAQQVALETCLGEKLDIDMLRIAKEKYLVGAQLQERRDRIASHWLHIQQRLRNQLVAFEELRHMLERAACPVQPGEIGLDRTMVRYGMVKARIIRPRYTVFDLAYECGLLDGLIDEVVDSGRWFASFA
ncbi:MAG TPA: sn-glycerol-1-phosphate dehydrogenase [Sphaerochaeta sp.]|nr:sn-glycerol-1-phosphate dehydrogenase [Sphaerochaeta sp.]